MTKMTDRIADSNLIELAKQQYESKQKSTVPSVVVNLTSKGLVYPESHPLRKGYVHMRHITAYDEDIITNETYIKEGIMFDMLLASLIVDDINVDDIAECDLDGLIIAAKIHGYGPEYNVVVYDTIINKNIEATINLSGLTTTKFNLVPDKNGEFLFKMNDEFQIKFRYTTLLDSHKINTTERASSSFLLSIIKEVNGDRSIDRIEHFIKYECIGKMVKLFRTHYFENAPKLITSSTFESANGDTFTAGFQLRSDILWS